MSIETVDYPFLEEQNLKEYIRTLQDISNRNYAPIQCDQGSSQNYKAVHACDYAVKLIKAELDVLLNRKEIMMTELSKKYGKYDKDWVVDLSGGVHLLKAESKSQKKSREVFKQAIETLGSNNPLEWLGKNCKDCGNKKCKELGKLPKKYSCALWQPESEK